MLYTTTLRDIHTGYAAWCALWQTVKTILNSGQRVEVSVKSETRSSAQNKLMWQRLEEVSRSVLWDGERMTGEEWKDWFTAALRQQRMVRGMNGGVVFLGQRTSKMTIPEMTEMLDLISAFGAQQGVAFKDEASTDTGKETR